MKLVKRLGGLRIQEDVARKVQLADFIEMFDDNGIGMCLTYQSQYLSMTFLAEDDNLAVSRWLSAISIILFLDTFLEL